MKFANVIVDISSEKLDKIFQYIIPVHLQQDIRAGVQVVVPFGRGNRTCTGYVLEIAKQADVEISRLKEILEVKTGSIPVESQMIALAAWMKEATGCTFSQALKTVLPIKREVRDREKIILSLAIAEKEAKKLAEGYEKRKNTISRAKLLDALIKQGKMEKEEAKQGLGVSDSVIRAMKKAGFIRYQPDKVYRDPFVIRAGEMSEKRIVLNAEQQRAAEEMIAAIERQDRRAHLLYGVTGSGKTEVYMELIDYMLARKKQVIVLIPEIALTYQAVLRYYRRFGDRIAVIHSKLSAGEKYDQFEKARQGLADIMIGPRSALFTPFSNLGLIIIDEEQEGAYKSESLPRYHAVETAIARADIAGAHVVLGTATPSVISYYRAKTGRYLLHTLKSRAVAKDMAKVSVVDMRLELKTGNKSVFSRELEEKIRVRLDLGQQVMLFINRRGYASFVSCRSCGAAIKCPHCDVTLKYHNNGTLRCHYCGYKISAPKRCPVCSSPFIAPFGTGTQKVEEAVRKKYPQARILRMDMDTARGKEDHNRIIGAFANHEADILIGTQMIVKGHDFPLVTLVGILAADLSLYASEYTAAEKTYQLLAQAAGRAGRGKLPGEVVIQTYNPEEYSIVAASHQNYEEFYQNEINYRKLMKYPPAAGMLTVQIASRDEETAKRCADILYQEGTDYPGGPAIIGPSRASVYKRNDVYRYRIYLKGKEELLQIWRRMEERIKVTEEFKNAMVQYDFENI